MNARHPGTDAGQAEAGAPDEAGQAAVELALVLPVVALLLAALVQVGLIVRDQVLLTHAAREVARELAVQEAAPGARPPPPPSAAVAAAAARRATGGALAANRLEIAATATKTRVRVRAGYSTPIRLPLVRNAARYVRLAAYAEAYREID